VIAYAYGNIHTVSPYGADHRQITRLDGYCADLQWSSDSQRIYFHHTEARAAYDDPNHTTSWVVNRDGSGLRRLRFNLGDRRVWFWFQYSIRHPGDLIAYSALDATHSGGVIWVMGPEGSQPRQITRPKERSNPTHEEPITVVRLSLRGRLWRTRCR
jgi:Tol biopolymer transport system component